MLKKIFIIITVIFGWLIFSRIIFKGVFLRARHDISFQMLNIPGIEPTVINLDFNKDTDLVLNNILFTVQKRNYFYFFRWSAYNLVTDTSRWIYIEPLPTFPLDINNYSVDNTLFIPSQTLDEDRYQIKIINDSTFLIRDNSENKIRKHKHFFQIGGIKINVIFYSNTARFEFLPSIPVFSVPCSVKRLYLGNYKAYFRFPHLMPRYIYPSNLYENIRKLCRNNVIYYDNKRKSIQIKIPEEESLRVVFNSVFRIDIVNGKKVIKWRHYARYLSKKRDRRDPLYGVFESKFLTPWQIVNNKVLGLKPSYLAVDISFGKYFTNILSHIKDRKKRSLFDAKRPVDPSLWNIFPASFMSMYLEDAVIQKDLHSQIEYFLKKKPYNDVYLSIDIKLQSLLREAIEDFDKTYTSKKGRNYFKSHFKLPYPHIGAVLLSENGEILAAVSYPFPKDYKEFYKYSVYNKFKSSRNSPTFNRVWKDVYPIGSTIKPFVAATSINADIFIKKNGILYVPDPNDSKKIYIDYKGYIDSVRNSKIKRLKNYKEYKYPFEITINDFLIRSINVASASLTCWLDEPKLDRMLGYFEHPDIFLLENKFFLNIPSTYQKTIGNPFWVQGGFIGYKNINNFSVRSRLAIGDQVYTSILYLASLYASFGENKKILPTLLPITEEQKPNVEFEPLFENGENEKVKRILRGVILNEHGTAYSAFMTNKHLRSLLVNNRLIVWGKTGTPEVGKQRKEHKLFVCSFSFPERNKKRYYLGVIVENSAHLYPFNPAAKIAAMFIDKFAKEEGL